MIDILNINNNNNIDNIDNNCKCQNCVLKCFKCKNEIKNKIGSHNICRACHNATFREYYHKKIKVKCGFKDKKGIETDYINSDGSVEKVIVKENEKVNKICKKCNLDKPINNFYIANSNGKKYLNSSCKTCALNYYMNKLKNIKTQ